MKPLLACCVVLAVGCGGPGTSSTSSQAPTQMGAPQPKVLFAYESDAAPSTGGGLSRGVAWGDFDTDGDPDLVIANGTESEVDLRNFLYLNDGAGRFVAVTEGDLVDTPNISAGVAWADVDLDGDLDLFIANWGGDNEDNAFYRNHTAGKSWLVIRLTGTKSNRMAWGARVRVTTTIDGFPRTQTRWMNPTTGYASQNEPILHFGLGDAGHIDSIEITWPSGTVDHLGPVDANLVLEVTEGQGYPEPPAEGSVHEADSR